MTRREQKRRWREELKLRPPHPTWAGTRLSANMPIDDNAFVPTDTYRPRTHEAIVVTQHAPHTVIDPTTLALIAAIDKAAAKKNGKKPRKALKPDDRWLNNPPTPSSYTGPPLLGRYVPVNWNNFGPSHILGMVICNKCGTHISDELMVDDGRRQYCPHKF